MAAKKGMTIWWKICGIWCFGRQKGLYGSRFLSVKDNIIFEPLVLYTLQVLYTSRLIPWIGFLNIGMRDVWYLVLVVFFYLSFFFWRQVIQGFFYTPFQKQSISTLFITCSRSVTDCSYLSDFVTLRLLISFLLCAPRYSLPLSSSPNATCKSECSRFFVLTLFS